MTGARTSGSRKDTAATAASDAPMRTGVLRAACEFFASALCEKWSMSRCLAPVRRTSRSGWLSRLAHLAFDTPPVGGSCGSGDEDGAT